MEIQLAVGSGQQAELKKESGVRIQEEKNIKSVLSFWLLTTWAFAI
jgi:hypothetical protein